MMFQPLNDFNPLTLPRTVNQVVELLCQDLSLRDKVVMAQLSEKELDSGVCLATAKTIRKEFRLYSGNSDLLKSCCNYLGIEYDISEEPAMVILKELWKKIKKTHSLHLVTSNTTELSN